MASREVRLSAASLQRAFAGACEDTSSPSTSTPVSPAQHGIVRLRI